MNNEIGISGFSKEEILIIVEKLESSFINYTIKEDIIIINDNIDYNIYSYIQDFSKI